ncbi:MAG: hypothetical protein ACHQX3_00475 [Nitrospirales bacterium]
MVIRPYIAAEAHAQAQIGDDEPLSLTCEFCGQGMEIMPDDDMTTYAIQKYSFSEPEIILCSEDCAIKYTEREGIKISEGDDDEG